MENCKELKQIERARDAAQEKRESEPSPEAKQAAEWEPFKDSIKCSDGSVLFVGHHNDAVAICNAHNQQLYNRESRWREADAATAKAREDVFNAVFPKGTENGNESWEQILKAIRDTHEELMEAMKQLRESDVEIAKLREELEHIRIAANGHFEKDSLNIPIPLARRVYLMSCALAHQQPSAITTNEQAYRDGTLSQPIAPTADVEKIAIETRNRIVAYLLDRVKDPLRRYEEEVIREVISIALAQVNAPQGNIWVCDKCGEEWQQALDQQQQTNAEIVEKVEQQRKEQT